MYIGPGPSCPFLPPLSPSPPMDEEFAWVQASLDHTSPRAPCCAGSGRECIRKTHLTSFCWFFSCARLILLRAAEATRTHVRQLTQTARTAIWTLMRARTSKEGAFPYCREQYLPLGCLGRHGDHRTHSAQQPHAGTQHPRARPEVGVAPASRSGFVSRYAWRASRNLVTGVYLPEGLYVEL